MGAGGRRKDGGEGGCGAGVEVIGGDYGTCDDFDTEGGRCWAGGAQDGRTPLYIACYYGHGEVVKLLLADEMVAANQAREVRVGGKGEGGWRERAGRAEGCGTERSACHGGGRQEVTSAGRRV